MRGEQPGYVLDEKPLASKRLSDSGELKEEAGAIACETSSLSDDAEVLTGESAGEELNTPIRSARVVTDSDSPGALMFGIPVVRSSSPWVEDKSNVLIDGYSRPVSGKDGSPVGIGLAEESVGVACSGESEVEAADA